MAGAGKLLREAWLIWLFNLGYYLLANMAQVMTFFIIGKESGGLFGSAQYLVLALQMFLHYFGILMAPRLMVWQGKLAMFRRCVLLIAGGASAVDWLPSVCCGQARIGCTLCFLARRLRVPRGCCPAGAG